LWHTRFSIDRNKLSITLANGKTYSFYGDSDFSTTPIIFDELSVVVIGDGFGRVLFLRWVVADDAGDE